MNNPTPEQLERMRVLALEMYFELDEERATHHEACWCRICCLLAKIDEVKP